MTLSEVGKVSQDVATAVGGTVVRKEFVMTNKNIYVLCHEVDNLNDFLIWISENRIVPLLIIKQEVPYQVGDEVTAETDLFVYFMNDVQAIQGKQLLRITDGFVTIIEELKENAL